MASKEVPAAAAAAAPAGPSSTQHQSTAAATGPTTSPAAAAAAAVGARAGSAVSLFRLVPSEVHGSYRRHLLLAVDNSSNSTHALEWAIQHMYRVGDKFHLVHVVPEPPTLHPWTGVYVPPDDALEREEFKEGAALIQAAFAPLVTRAAIPCDAHLIVAPTEPDAIVNILLQKQEDLGAAALLVAPHSKSGLQEWWLGSVTKGLLKHAAVPVVVIPPPRGC